MTKSGINLLLALFATLATVARSMSETALEGDGAAPQDQCHPRRGGRLRQLLMFFLLLLQQQKKILLLKAWQLSTSLPVYGLYRDRSRTTHCSWTLSKIRVATPTLLGPGILCHLCQVACSLVAFCISWCMLLASKRSITEATGTILSRLIGKT